MPFAVIEKHTHPQQPRLSLLLRTGQQNWLARTYLHGKLRYKSTGTPVLTTALRLANEWYVALLRTEQNRTSKRKKHPRQIATIGDAYEHYAASLTKPSKQDTARFQWGVCEEFWSGIPLDEVSPRVFKDFYAKRRAKKIGTHTLHKNVTLIRQILKHCAEEEIIKSVPVIPRVGTIKHNPRKWLTLEDWQHLQKVSRQRIKDAPNVRTKKQRQDTHDFAVFMVHSMMRVDEVRHLTFGDCRVGKNSKGEPILRVNVRISKTGERPDVVCLKGAVSVYQRRLTKDTAPTDLIFPHSHIGTFRELLKAANLYWYTAVVEGEECRFTRNAKSLRATGISFRILNGANLMLVAKNSGTSVLSIQHFYANYLRPTDDIDELTKMA